MGGEWGSCERMDRESVGGEEEGRGLEPVRTAAARALNDDDRGDREDDKAGGVQSCGARSVSGEASGGGGGAG